MRWKTRLKSLFHLIVDWIDTYQPPDFHRTVTYHLYIMLCIGRLCFPHTYAIEGESYKQFCEKTRTNIFLCLIHGGKWDLSRLYVSFYILKNETAKFSLDLRLFKCTRYVILSCMVGWEIFWENVKFFVLSARFKIYQILSSTYQQK